jgi:hypothetical protein
MENLLTDQVFGELKLSVEAEAYSPKGTFYLHAKGPQELLANAVFEIRATDQTKTEILKSWAIKGEAKKDDLTYTATLPFAHNGPWNVEIKAKNKQNGDIISAVTLPVEVGDTPPKTPSYTYILPIALVAFIAVRFIISKRKKSRKT